MIKLDEEAKGGARTPKMFEVEDIKTRVLVDQPGSAEGMESLVNSLQILASKAPKDSELSKKLETEEADQVGSFAFSEHPANQEDP